MGIFNYVNHSCPCPNCGHTLSSFQSKDGSPCMETVEPWEVYSFYTFCQECNVFVEFTRTSDTLPKLADIAKTYKKTLQLVHGLLNNSTSIDRIGLIKILEKSLNSMSFPDDDGWLHFYTVKYTEIDK